MSSNNNRTENNYELYLNIIPVISIVIFTFLFKNLNTYSYCNLTGELCDNPIISIVDNSIINVSCKVSDNNSNETQGPASIHLIRFTYVGFGLLLLLIILGSTYYIINNKEDIYRIIAIIVFNSIICGSVIFTLVDNSHEINLGHIDYGLSKGFINIIWILNILYLLFLIILIVYTIIKGSFVFNKNIIVIIIIIIILLIQIIIYAIFMDKCGKKPEYKCMPNITYVKPTLTPTVAPTVAPTAEPTTAPTAAPTAEPTTAPTAEPIPINTLLQTTESDGEKFTEITSDTILSKYKTECITTGINNMNLQTAQLVLSILAIIVLLVNIDHIFSIGLYIPTTRNIYSVIISIIILILLFTLIVLSFI